MQNVYALSSVYGKWVHTLVLSCHFTYSWSSLVLANQEHSLRGRRTVAQVGIYNMETWTKWSIICRLHFQMHFLEWKWLYFEWDFIEMHSWGCILNGISLRCIPGVVFWMEFQWDAFLGGVFWMESQWDAFLGVYFEWSFNEMHSWGCILNRISLRCIPGSVFWMEFHWDAFLGVYFEWNFIEMHSWGCILNGISLRCIQGDVYWMEFHWDPFQGV